MLFLRAFCSVVLANSASDLASDFSAIPTSSESLFYLSAGVHRGTRGVAQPLARMSQTGLIHLSTGADGIETVGSSITPVIKINVEEVARRLNQ
ncbi:hypothetical protein N9B05_01565 [Mariniblastus sp.]|nr:hypothetical protein [Mariniblastus sp.]